MTPNTAVAATTACRSAKRAGRPRSSARVRANVKSIRSSFVQDQSCTKLVVWQIVCMKITSPAFAHNESIPATYTCDGEDISPPLQLSNVPSEAKSLVLVMDDPDAPGGTWDHWVIFNIPPGTTAIPAGEEPPGVHGTGTTNNTNYHGPCPPDTEHRYFFKFMALDITLTLPPGARKTAVEQAMQGHIMARAELVGRYERKQ